MLSNEEVLQIITSELAQSNSSSGTGGTINDLETSLNYYLGNPNGKEVDGRSQVTSTDVADAIEWIMPQIMKSFTQNNEVVAFDPIHKEDELQAEIESQYVYEILMKQNDGFILIHQFVKDALMQRNGILKVYYEDKTKEWTSSYTGISEEELNVLGSAPNAEIIEISEEPDLVAHAIMMKQFEAQVQQMQQQMQQNPQMAQDPQYMQQMAQMQPPEPPVIYDVKVKFSEDKGRIVIESIPPEEFIVNQEHNSINLDGARFTAHIIDTTFSALMEEGYDIDVINKLPIGSDSGDYYSTEYRFAAQNEDIEYNYYSDDKSQSHITISECFLLMDYNEDGISELCKVTVAGETSPSHLLSIEEIDMMPWVSTTAIIMSHKWQGLSIYDRLKEIQDQKTALWRSMFDNIYFQNNQRTAVVEGQVNIDDMLVSRPNGIVRVKRLDSIMPIVTPQLSTDSYSMMAMLDEVKAGRSGVSAEGGSTPQNIGNRVGSQGVDRMMNAKEALVGLIIRVVAETGIKPLCVKIRDLSTKHVDSIVDFRFRSQWQKIQPSTWVDRTSTTVRVGTGTGDVTEKTNALTFIMSIQEKLQMMPEQTLTGQPQIYNTLDEYCQLVGLNGADKYFIDPTSPQGKQDQQQKQQELDKDKQQQDGIQQTIAESQLKLAEAEIAKAQAQQTNVQLKAQNDMTKNQLQSQKQSYESQIDMLEQQLNEATMVADSIGKSDDLQFKYDDMNARNALELTRIEAEKERDLNAQYQQNIETTEGKNG